MRATTHSDPRPRSDGRALAAPVLVAFDERHPAEGALHVAQALAQRDHVNAHLVGLGRPLAFPAALVLAADLEAVEEARRQQLLQQVRRTLQEAHGIAAFWSTEAALGPPAMVVSSIARARRSALIVLGIPRIGDPDRSACEDSALQVIRTAPVPVLTVPPDVERLPRRALVAIDFSTASRRAAAAALGVLGSPAAITLAHVQPDVDFTVLGRPGWDAIYASGRDALFRELTTELGTASDVTIETVVLHGDPARALLEHAEQGSYDLVAAGTEGLAPVDRQLVGSVSTGLLRGARSMVLIAPPVERAT